MRLQPSGAPAPAISAILVDISAHGFRARHQCGNLASGQTVAFEHPFGCGRARVAWTRIGSGAVESGFYVLP